MAGENDKTFTEADMALLLADRVAKETADLTTERDALKAERDELLSKLDVEQTARATAEQEAEKAREELTTFKADLEALREAADRKDARMEQVQEVAAHMGEDFLKDEARVTRIVAMEEAAFADYVAALKEAAPAAPAGSPIPRESAMSGGATPDRPTVSAAKSVLFGRYASKEG